MEIQAIKNINFPLIHRELAKGQQVKVEILNREANGKAQIRLNGQEIAAVLDFAEQVDSFNATVLNIEDQKILLQKQEEPPTLVSQAQQKLLSGSNPSLAPMLTEALSRLEVPKDHTLRALIEEVVPQWSQLLKDGKTTLAGLIQRLGLDYEHRLMSLLTLPSEHLEAELPQLAQTLKGSLLALLGQALSTRDGETQSLVSALLEGFTEQQLQLHGAHKENPFYSFEIPLRLDGSLYSPRIAIKAARKGMKLDSDHCRLAIQATTPTLGELGIEGWLYEGQLTLKIMTDDPEALTGLIEENRGLLREQLNLLGISLTSLGVAPWSEAGDFQRFLRGEFREGVDLRI